MRMSCSVWFVLLFWLAGCEFAAARNLTLSWNASTATDVAGYNLYYGTSCGCYTNKVNVGNVTLATLSNLAAGVTYYISATSYDLYGNESGFSNETSFIVPGLLTMSLAATAGGAATMQFPVEPGHWYEVQATADLSTWATIWQTDVATTNVWTQFTDTNAGAFSARFYRLILH